MSAAGRERVERWGEEREGGVRVGREERVEGMKEERWGEGREEGGRVRWVACESS